MVLIITSCGSPDEADRIAGALVGKGLAACIQMIPVTSVYRWQGAIERTEEVSLHVKTRAGLAGRVEQRIAALHSYALPEIILLPVAGGSAAYLAWVKAQTEA